MGKDALRLKFLHSSESYKVEMLIKDNLNLLPMKTNKQVFIDFVFFSFDVSCHDNFCHPLENGVFFGGILRCYLCEWKVFSMMERESDFCDLPAPSAAPPGPPLTLKQLLFRQTASSMGGERENVCFVDGVLPTQCFHMYPFSLKVNPNSQSTSRPGKDPPTFATTCTHAISQLTSAWELEVSFSVFPVGPLFGELGPDPGELLLTEDSGVGGKK